MSTLPQDGRRDHLGGARLPESLNSRSFRSQVVLLDVLDDELKVLGLLTVVLDGNRRSALNLSGLTLLVVLAETEPLAQVQARVNLDQGDAASLGHSLQEKKHQVRKMLKLDRHQATTRHKQ